MAMAKMKSTAAVGLVMACAAAATVSADTFGTGDNQFTIDFVTISGDASSANGTFVGNDKPEGFLDPGHDYRMGVYEITNGQWDKFKASLGVPVTGSPAWAYDGEPLWTGSDIPNNRATWLEAAQFINWLNTSTGHQTAYCFAGKQGTSDYALSMWSPDQTVGVGNPYRHKNAFYFLPTEDEWLKAAYWNGTTLQEYANASTDDLVSGYPDPAKWCYSPYSGWEPRIVGGGVQELNGTYDMMGNVREWTESPYHSGDYGAESLRVLRGGSANCHETGDPLSSSWRYSRTPTNEHNNLGFRIAAAVPEPSSLVLLALSGLALIRRRFR